MTAEVVTLHIANVGDGATVAPDQVLTEAVGNYRSVVLVGETLDGELQVCGSHGTADSLLSLAWAQHFLVSNRCLR